MASNSIPGAGPPLAALRYQPLVVRSVARYRRRVRAIEVLPTSAEARRVLCARAFERHRRLVDRLCRWVAPQEAV